MGGGGVWGNPWEADARYQAANLCPALILTFTTCRQRPCCCLCPLHLPLSLLLLRSRATEAEVMATKGPRAKHGLHGQGRR